MQLSGWMFVEGGYSCHRLVFFWFCCNMYDHHLADNVSTENPWTPYSRRGFIKYQNTSTARLLGTHPITYFIYNVCFSNKHLIHTKGFPGYLGLAKGSMALADWLETCRLTEISGRIFRGKKQFLEKSHWIVCKDFSLSHEALWIKGFLPQ